MSSINQRMKCEIVKLTQLICNDKCWLQQLLDLRHKHCVTTQLGMAQDTNNEKETRKMAKLAVSSKCRAFWSVFVHWRFCAFFDLLLDLSNKDVSQDDSKKLWKRQSNCKCTNDKHVILEPHFQGTNAGSDVNGFLLFSSLKKNSKI